MIVVSDRFNIIKDNCKDGNIPELNCKTILLLKLVTPHNDSQNTLLNMNYTVCIIYPTVRIIYPTANLY